MSLSDPTSGAGYSFGEKLPSAHMTTIATQLPDALDIVNGGTYTQGADIQVNMDGTDAIVFAATSGTPHIDFAVPVEVEESMTIDGDDGGTLTFDGLLNFPIVESQTVQRYQDMIPLYNGNDRFAFDPTGNAWDQDDVAGPGTFAVPIANRPPTGTLTAVTLYVDGDGAGNTHAGLPAGLPSIQVDYSRPSTLFSHVTTASQGDTSATLVAYEGVHTIALTGISVSLADAADLTVRIFGEQGANSTAGALRLLGLICYFTVTEIAP